MRAFLVIPVVSLCTVFGQTLKPASAPIAVMPSDQDAPRKPQSLVVRVVVERGL